MFGTGYDIAMCPDSKNNKWIFNTASYPNLNISENFEITDYEAFQVVKK
jgi:hypothetical protein